MAKVAVVILNYNGKNFLKKFLNSVINYSANAEVIVADNKSTDDSVYYLQSEHPQVRIIQLDENYGFSEGYNRALKEVRAEYYIILNSDVEVAENWIGPVISLMDANSEIAACQPKLLSYHNKEQFEYAGAAGGFIDILGYPFCRGRLFQSIENDEGQYNETTDIFWATGACLFIRSSVFHEVKGFDDDYFAHMEEIDLCWRINAAGYRICYVPESVVYHVGGGTLPKENPRKTYLNFRNSLTTLYKNTGFAGLIWKLPLRLLLDIIAAIKFLLTDGADSFLAVIRANFHFYFKLYKHRDKRKVARSMAKRKIGFPYKNLLIVDYYLKQQRKFSQLKVRQ